MEEHLLMSLLCEISADSGFTPGRTVCQCTDTCSFLHFELTVISSQSTLLVPDAPVPCLLASSHFGFGFLYIEFLFLLPLLVFLSVL